MPPLPFVPNGVKFRVAGSQGSGEFGMLFHWAQLSGSDITDSDAAMFASAIHTSWATNIAPILSSDQVLTSVVVEGIQSSTDGVGAWAGSEPGSGFTTIAPANVCVLQKDVIARRYRGGHPRHYWPAPTTAALSDPTHLTTTAQSYWTNAVENFLADIGTEAGSLWGAGSAYSVPTYYSGGVLRPSPFLQTIVGFSIENMLATQRRRIGR